jgi:1,2-diacylglycerol 3-beta-galactosyltransferase
VETCDPLICQGRPVVRRLTSLYPKIIQRSGAAWGVIYHTSNTRVAFGALRGVFGRQVRGVIEAAIKEHDPDVVLSVHPLLNHVAQAAIRRSGRRRGLMTVVTDLIELHRGWAQPEADLVVVPTEEASQVVGALGVPSDRIRALGLPVDLRFRPPAPGEKQALRRRFGLEEGRPTLLVLGGGDGSGKLLRQVRALAWGEHDWQVIAVCGRNEKLRRRLSRVRFSTPTAVLGFVDFMPALMRAADLVVTKAGPGAIAEALATGVPMVLTGYLPGQETMNVRFVTQSGFGLYAPRPDELRQAVTRILAGGSGQVQDMAARAAAIARPYASLDIARECLAIAARYSAAKGAGSAAGPGGTGEDRNGRGTARRGWLGWALRDASAREARKAVIEAPSQLVAGAGVVQPEANAPRDGFVERPEDAGLAADIQGSAEAPKPAGGRRFRPGGRGKRYRAASQGRR